MSILWQYSSCVPVSDLLSAKGLVFSVQEKKKWGEEHRKIKICSRVYSPSMQVIQAVFFGICVLTDLSSLLTRGNDSQEQERQLKKLISLRDWMMAVLAFPVGVVSTVLICACLCKLDERCYLLNVFFLKGFPVSMQKTTQKGKNGRDYFITLLFFTGVREQK